MDLQWTRLAALALWSALGVAGCGGKYSDYCERRVKCEQGNDKDVDVCEIEAERLAGTAEIYDCEDRWDAFYECVEGVMGCDAEEESCRSQMDAFDACVR